MDAYMELPAPALDHVKNNFPTCEDILLNFMVTNLTGHGPVLVKEGIGLHLP
eukprot:Awhi_evm1s10087